jgi:hypothetical protein
MNLDKRDKSMAFDYLVKNAPVNSLQEVLNNILPFYNFKLAPDTSFGAILEYHHTHFTLLMHKKVPLILTPCNFIKSEGGFKCSYVNNEVDPETGKRGMPKKYNVEVSTQAVISVDDAPQDIVKQFTPHEGVFKTQTFDTWLNSHFTNPNVLKHYLAKNTTDEFVFVMTLKFYQKNFSQ